MAALRLLFCALSVREPLGCDKLLLLDIIIRHHVIDYMYSKIFIFKCK